MTLMGLAASFNLDLANVWGQTAGKEARWYMVTGIYGPQGDIDVLPNWGRNLTTTGEDPFLSEKMVAAQVDGMQGNGAMSQMKHYAVYNGQNGNTTYQDQWLHEVDLPLTKAATCWARRRQPCVRTRHRRIYLPIYPARSRRSGQPARLPPAVSHRPGH
jgi:beta-glucosidase-like glycosyl hydrolase